ncbi:autotransporter domain-containing protein [Sebaldella sp. S0638]|nr:autotransporter domain-containing protein [Sebaldella sp. S0638]MCP1225670.1 autotransporter domain-containing protein [Sebaldella sp. S0638]
MTERTTGIYTNAAQAIDNEGTVNNMTSDAYSLTLNDGTVLNYAAQPDGSKNTVGVYITKNNGNALNTEILPGETTADIHYRQNGGSIRIGGENSVALYNNNDKVKIMNNAEIEAANGAVGLYTKGNGTIGSAVTIINQANLTVGDKSLLFYNESGGQIDFQGATTALIKSGGTAFYSKGTTALTDYLNISNLTVKMEDNSTLLMLEEPAADVYLNALPGVTGINIDPSSSSNFKKVSQYRGKFFINQNVLLDNDFDDYVQTSLISTKTELMAGFSVTGSKDGQVGIKTGANTAITLTSDVSAVNNGLIQLSGNNSVGLYTNFGTNTNTDTLTVTGAKGVGQFAENGSVVLNSGNITIGNEGAGIYAVSFQDPANEPLFGDKKINVTNTGNITSNIGAKSVGIYLNNNKGLATSDAKLNLGTGTINVKNSDNGIGVYADKIEISGGGNITVGRNGVGIYAKDSDLYLSSLNINLHGDNSLGLYLEGNSNLWTGTGNIDIDGQNVVLYNIKTNAGTTINNDFTVTSTTGSTYTLGGINEGSVEYTGNSNLTSNGTLVSGKNSTIYLNGSVITSDSGSVNVAAVALDGQGSGSITGMTMATDGENNGSILLGNSSVGIYGKNGSRISNVNMISVGDSSAGLMTSGLNSSAVNSGTITVGTGSQGIYLKDGDRVENLGTGIITGSGTGAIGIYADNNSSAVMQIRNNGTINLADDKAIGIYSIGTNSHNIINNMSAILEIGNSTSTSDPGIGIYSAVSGSTITNFGTVTSGKNSIGIYSNGGVVNNNGISNIGDSGVGIYSTGGIVNLNMGSSLNMGTNGAVGVYGVYSAVRNSWHLNVGSNNYGFIIKGGSFTNDSGTNSVVDKDSVFMYSSEAATVVNNGSLMSLSSDNIGFYMGQDSVSGLSGAAMTNNGSIFLMGGNNNVGIYNYGGTVDNYGTVNVADSGLVFITKKDGSKELDIEESKYAVGIYGENASIVNHASGSISAGYGGYGIVAKGGTAVNDGLITTTGDYSTGMYTEGGIVTNNHIINVTGNNTIGMAGKGAGAQLINNGQINITGDNAIGMYANIGTVIINNGTIDINGANGQIFVSSDPADTGHNVETGSAIINGSTTGNIINSAGTVHTLPELINAGIIKTSGVLALGGIQVMIKPDPSTKQASSNPDYDFELSGTSITADHITTSKPIVILPGFADGTNANVYKLEGVINATSGQYDFISGSLLWEATPKATGTGSDVYMSRKSFTDFTDGLWFEEFGSALENNYLSASEDGVKIYNKTGYIKTEEEFRNIMGSLAGNVYSNINHRENDIAESLENSLNLMQDSVNNTKENVKVSVIAGKGKNNEKTDGVTGYDYTTAGALALREVERTYRHTFGYSLGYLHTVFEFKDGNESEEWVDTIQLGAHNKYKSNDWELRNDLTGRVSFHNIDRNIDWGSPLGRSEMNGTYETYSITSDNILGKNFDLNKKVSIVPYGGFRVMYVTRPTFSETGLESLQVKGNDAWSVKPRAGVELKGVMPVGESWKLKGTLNFAYEYELADLNEREYAKLTSIETGYHKLSKPEDDKGIIRTGVSMGLEIEDRYGVFVTGDYKTGNDKEDDYRVGVTLKAVF